MTGSSTGKSRPKGQVYNKFYQKELWKNVSLLHCTLQKAAVKHAGRSQHTGTDMQSHAGDRDNRPEQEANALWDLSPLTDLALPRAH